MDGAPRAQFGKLLLTKSEQTPVGLDVDCVDGFVYWADVTSKGIHRAQYNGTYTETIMQSENDSPGKSVSTATELSLSLSSLAYAVGTIQAAHLVHHAKEKTRPHLTPSSSSLGRRGHRDRLAVAEHLLDRLGARRD